MRRTVEIRIDYRTLETRVYQAGEFPLKGKKPEEVALEFWRKIQKQMPFAQEIEKVRCEGEDITELVKELEKAPLD